MCEMGEASPSETRTFGIGFDEQRISWNDTLLHRHNGLHQTRNTGSWLRMANIAFDLQ